jgi:hypothetical protein
MNFEQRIAAAFRMSDEVWERHANPWSVWSRFTALPLLVLAIWSRAWIGRWAVVPTAAALLWTWLNPRLFPRPASTDNWASKGVLGERVWLNRETIPVPAGQRTLPHLLNVVSGVGTVLVVWGLIARAVWPTVLGTVLAYLGKLWFVDRMVWLYEAMKDADPRYRSWLY